MTLHNDAFRVLIYWGPAGSGKTRAALTGRQRTAFVLTRQRLTFQFQDYRQGQALVMDDFSSETMEWASLLSLLQGEAIYMPVKMRRPVRVSPHTVVITSRIDPMLWHVSVRRGREALYRRLGAPHVTIKRFLQDGICIHDARFCSFWPNALDRSPPLSNTNREE